MSSDFSEGVRKELPVALATIPFGLILGASLYSWHIPTLPGLSTSFVIFAGSSQFITLQMLSAQSPAWAVIFAALATNLRHIFYTIKMSSFLSTLPFSQKALACYLLTDECFAVVNTLEEKNQLSYKKYLGAGFTLWFIWNISTLVGCWLGNFLPKNLQLEKTIDFTFLAILTLMVTNSQLLLAVAFVAFGSIFTSFLPFKLNIILGIAFGFLADNLFIRKKQ